MFPRQCCTRAGNSSVREGRHHSPSSGCLLKLVAQPNPHLHEHRHGRGLDPSVSQKPGLTGIISEEGTGRPLLAQVKVLPRDDLDPDVMPRTTESSTGRYYRALQPGTYSVMVEAQGMQSKKFQDVVVAPNGWTELHCRLDRQTR